MPDNIDLVAEFREDQGKGASRRLRNEGKVPALIYGAGRPPRSISLQHNKLLRALQKVAVLLSHVPPSSTQF